MLNAGRLPTSAAEHDVVEKLIAKHGQVSLTRRDPGDTGPLLVAAGDDTYEIGDDGKARKQKAAI